MHPLVNALADIATAYPAANVRFVAREVSFAREILRGVARSRGALVGWEGTTLRQFADELATGALDREGLVRAADLDLQAAASDALDATAAALPEPLRRQAGSLGFRTAAFDAFAELRLAGVAAAALHDASRIGSPARALVPAYTRYGELLRERRLADAAESFRAAIQRLDAGGTPDTLIVVEPGAADVAGLPRAFAELLRARGALFPALDPDRPDWATIAVTPFITRAASPSLEVRDALRHALEHGCAWNDVELAVSDPDTYGVALASLGDQLGIPYTLKEGVPMMRSRAGRAIEHYFRWIEDGLPVSSIRQALEQGELPTGDAGASAADVARVLRSAGIGWGRDRWLAAVPSLENGVWAAAHTRPEPDADPDESPQSRAARLLAIAQVSARLIGQLATVMPAVQEPAASGRTEPTLRTSELASLALGWLQLVAPMVEASGERHALERLRRRLELFAEHDRPPTRLSLAMAELRLGLADLRAFPSVDGERARRVSAPGAVHLTDMAQAGASGRAHIYLLGLDADRMSTAPGGDPLLDETTRERLAPALLTLRERGLRRSRGIARAVRGLSGTVWMSYATMSDGGGRDASPAPMLLDAARVRYGAPDLTYDQMRERLGPPAGAARGHAPLDARDTWLRALAAGADLLDGRAQVRAAWPSLARGLALHATADHPDVTEWHGLVPDAAARLGPFADATRWTSPTSLELLGRCPLAWFYRYGLELQPPDDVAHDPDTWLDPRAFGTLLHAILERFVREWMPRQDQLATDAAQEALFAIVHEAVAAQRAEIPPPSELVFAQEVERLERSVRHFLAKERADRERRTAAWHAVEARFPAKDASAVFVTAAGVRLAIGGRIDRVDRLADGTFRVIDYKSGGSGRYRIGSKDAPLKGGRIMQPAIYAAGASQSLAGPVSGFEYRFPRERSPEDVIALDASTLAAAPAIVDSLLTHLETGAFIPTDDAQDCAYCDYRPICRADGDGTDTVTARAAWGTAHGAEAPAYVALRRRRSTDAVEDAS